MRRLLVPVLIVLLAACGASDDAGHAARSVRPTVVAASSLTEAFTDLGGATFSFAGSQSLVAQIREGAPADVFAAADQRSMQTLVDAGLVETPIVFARNHLAIAVRPGNPKHITDLADLARADLAVVLADPTVPVGNYARQALAKAGVTVHAASLELDVKAALAKVTLGDADATIVYASDVLAAGAKATGVAIPDDVNVTATYPIAVVKASTRHDEAEAFVQRVRSKAGRAILRRHGFIA